MATHRMKNRVNVVNEVETNGLDVKPEDDSRDARMGLKLLFVCDIILDYT